MRARTALVVTVVSALLALAAGLARADHFDGNAATGSFNPLLSVSVGPTVVNRVGAVRMHLTQEDHEDPLVVSTFKTGEWQFPFPSLRQAETSAGVPTTRCRDAMDGYRNSPNGTGTGTQLDFSKRTDGKIVRAEKIGTGHLEVHADGISRPGGPIVWNGDAAFIRYDALAQEARLCFLFITNDSRVTSIPDPDPTGGGDDIEDITELIAEFPMTNVGGTWTTVADLTDLVTDGTFQTLNVSVLDLDIAFFAQTKGNWQAAVDFGRAPAVSGVHAYQGIFQTCPQNHPGYGDCKSNKGSGSTATTGGTVTRTIPFTITLPTPAITGPASSGPFANPVTITGTTVDAGTNVRVYSGSDPVGETMSDASKNWSLTATLANGNHNLTARVFDAGGESAASNAKSLVVDALAPLAPVFTSPGAGATVPTGFVDIAGTAEPNALIDVYEGLAHLGQVTASAGGSWSMSRSFTIKGSHTLRAFATDGVGNVGPDGTRTFNVTTPTPIITFPGEGAFLANDTFTVTGTAEMGATVDLIADGSPLGSVVAVDGTWSAGPFTFSEAFHAITAIATGADSFVSLPMTRTFTIDLTPPAAPVITKPLDGAKISTSTVTIGGTAEPFSTVQVLENGSVVGSGATSAGGAWSVNVGVSNGVHTFVALAIDRAGNTSGLSAPITIDVAALLVTITKPAEGSFQPGSVLVEGTAEAGATYVLLYDGGVQVAKVAVSGGKWSKPLTLTSGTHTLTARGTNGTNDGPLSNARTITVDAAAPNLTIIKPSGFLLFQMMFLEPRVRGLAEEIHAFDSGVLKFEVSYENLFTGDVVQGAPVCTGCGTRDAAFEDTTALGLGFWTATVRAIDKVGNVATQTIDLFSLGF